MVVDSEEKSCCDPQKRVEYFWSLVGQLGERYDFLCVFS